MIFIIISLFLVEYFLRLLIGRFLILFMVDDIENDIIVLWLFGLDKIFFKLCFVFVECCSVLF